MTRRARFDPALDLERDAPKTNARPSVFKHPRVQEWLGYYLSERAAGRHISYETISKRLQRGSEVEGLELKGLSAENIRRWLVTPEGREFTSRLPRG